MHLGRLFRFLLLLERNHVWGDLTIHFQDGRLTVVHMNRSYKPETLPQPAPEKLAAADAEVERYIEGG